MKLSNSRVFTGSGYADTLDEKISRLICGEMMTGGGNCGMILSLTVGKNKNRCKPYGYWVTAIFAVVTDYSNLFFPFTFFLNCSHFTFG